MSMTVRFGANAESTEPMATAPSARRYIRRRPTRSPARPSSGVATAAEMSQAVSIHVWPTASAPMSAPMVDSTGMMSDWRLETAVKLVATAMKVMRVGDIERLSARRKMERLYWRETPIGGLLQYFSGGCLHFATPRCSVTDTALRALLDERRPTRADARRTSTRSSKPGARHSQNRGWMPRSRASPVGRRRHRHAVPQLSDPRRARGGGVPPRGRGCRVVRRGAWRRSALRCARRMAPRFAGYASQSACSSTD